MQTVSQKLFFTIYFKLVETFLVGMEAHSKARECFVKLTFGSPYS